jgi:cation diffusion facilitator CzcD-associated flavoprotein CzcO
MTSSAHAAIGADLDYAPQAQLGTSADGDRETDVLVIGSGPAGAAAALALATLGVRHMVITKYRWTPTRPPRTSPTSAPSRFSVTSASRPTCSPGVPRTH